MARAATLPLPYPEAAIVAKDSLEEQTVTLANELPDRPLVLGGCCCAHTGAVQGLSARRGRVGLVWLDAHGDLNTPQTSPSGNRWGMPLREVIASGAVAPGDVALVGARRLDPPEEEFIATNALRVGVEGIDAALAGTNGTYVAIDCDVLAADEVSVFMPEPGGLRVAEAEEVLARVLDRAEVLGAGFSGLVADHSNIPPLMRLSAALGL
jgi:arginase